MNPTRLKHILDTVDRQMQLPADITPKELAQVDDLIHHDAEERPGEEWTLTTLGEMELEELETNPDTARNVLRDLAQHLIEARNDTEDHGSAERLSMIDGGIADELLHRANAVLNQTLPPWT